MDIFILDCKNYNTRDLSYKFLLYALQQKFPKITPTILRTEFGKPFVSNIPDCHFSISHSGNFLVLAIHCKQVGIDIQKIKPINYKIVNRFFSQDEIYNFSLISNDKKSSYFFDLWTLKESFVKCCGLGFSNMTFNKFSIILDDKITLKANNQSDFNYTFDKFDNIQIGYKLAVCYEGDTSKFNFINVALDEI